MKKKLWISLVAVTTAVIAGICGMVFLRAAENRLNAQREEEVKKEMQAQIPYETERFYQNKENLKLVADGMRQLAVHYGTSVWLSEKNGMILLKTGEHEEITSPGKILDCEEAEFYSAAAALMENGYDGGGTYYYDRDKIDVGFSLYSTVMDSAIPKEYTFPSGSLSLIKDYGATSKERANDLPLEEDWYFEMRIYYGT